MRPARWSSGGQGLWTGWRDLMPLEERGKAEKHNAEGKALVSEPLVGPLACMSAMSAGG